MVATILFKINVQSIKEKNEHPTFLSKHTNRQRCFELIQIVLAEANGQIHRPIIEYSII